MVLFETKQNNHSLSGGVLGFFFFKQMKQVQYLKTCKTGKESYLVTTVLNF